MPLPPPSTPDGVRRRTVSLTRAVLAHGAIVAGTGIVFRLEAVLRGQIELGWLDWMVLPLPELALLGGIVALWSWRGPRGPVAGRTWRGTLGGTVLVLAVLEVVGQQFLIHTGTPLHREVVVHAVRRVGELGGLLSSALDPGLFLRVGWVAVIALAAHRWAPLRDVNGTHAPRRTPRLGLAAAGVAALVTFVARPHAAPSPTGVPLGLAPLVSGAGTGAESDGAAAIPYAMPSVTAPAPTGAPNLVVVVLESTRADIIHPYGPPEAKEVTPNLSRFAEDGVVVEDTYGTTTHTTKALVGILCGMYPHPDMALVETRPGGIPFPCLPDLLAAGGYRTGYIQSAVGAFEDRRVLAANMGFETIVTQEDMDTGAFEAVGYVAMDEHVMLEPALRFMSASRRPFFMGMLTSVPHHPYHVPGRPAPTIRDDPRPHYLASIHHVDAFVGALVTGMERRGILDHTVVVFVGDHGEAFGEHGVKQHDAVPYEEVTRTPLVFYAPERLDPRRVSGIRSHLDLMPTLLGLSGIEWTGTLPGRDALHESGHDIAVTSCWYDAHCAALRRGDLAFAYRFGRQPLEAFDLGRDPGQLEDLATEYATGQRRAIEGRILGVQATTRALWADTPPKARTRPSPAPAPATPPPRPNCMRACVADVDPQTPGLQVECRVEEVDRDGTRRPIPPCAPGGTPPNTATVCWLPRSDDALAEACRRQGFNLELRFPRTTPPAPGAIVDASCRLSEQPTVDCPRP